MAISESAKKLFQIRTGNNKTHADVADLVGVGRRSVGQWESGGASFAGTTAMVVFRVLETAGWDMNPPPPQPPPQFQQAYPSVQRKLSPEGETVVKIYGELLNLKNRLSHLEALLGERWLPGTTPGTKTYPNGHANTEKDGI